MTTSPVIRRNACPDPDHPIGQEHNQPGSRAAKRFDEESTPGATSNRRSRPAGHSPDET